MPAVAEGGGAVGAAPHTEAIAGAGVGSAAEVAVAGDKDGVAGLLAGELHALDSVDGCGLEGTALIEGDTFLGSRHTPLVAQGHMGRIVGEGEGHLRLVVGLEGLASVAGVEVVGPRVAAGVSALPGHGADLGGALRLVDAEGGVVGSGLSPGIIVAKVLGGSGTEVGLGPQDTGAHIYIGFIGLTLGSGDSVAAGMACLLEGSLEGAGVDGGGVADDDIEGGAAEVGGPYEEPSGDAVAGGLEAVAVEAEAEVLGGGGADHGLHGLCNGGIVGDLDGEHFLATLGADADALEHNAGGRGGQIDDYAHEAAHVVELEVGGVAFLGRGD